MSESDRTEKYHTLLHYWLLLLTCGKRPVSILDHTGLPLRETSKAPLLISWPDMMLQPKSVPG